MSGFHNQRPFLGSIAATNPLTGQIFMITPNQDQMGVQYFLPRSFLDPSGSGLAQAAGTQQRFIAHPTGHQRFQLHPAFAAHAQQNFNLIHPAQNIQSASISQPKPFRPASVEQQQSVDSGESNVQQPSSSTKLTSPSQSPRVKASSRASKPQFKPEKVNQASEPSPVKTKSSKEKCLFHYIEGQLIIETNNPLKDHKLKSSKKREKRKLDNNEITPIRESKKALNEDTAHTLDLKDESLDDSKAEESSEKNDQSDEIEHVRAEMLHWSVSDVVNFIEKHDDIRQYAAKFADEEVDGKALLLIIDNSHQSLATMFKLGPAIKVEAALSKYKLSE